jgi:hypothetical protein
MEQNWIILSWQLPEKFLVKAGHIRFLLRPFFFSIHYHRTIQRFLGSATENIVK